MFDTYQEAFYAMEWIMEKLRSGKWEDLQKDFNGYKLEALEVAFALLRLKTLENTEKFPYTYIPVCPSTSRPLNEYLSF